MVERYLVVKSSTGVMKVVALGPKLAKKKVCRRMQVRQPKVWTPLEHMLQCLDAMILSIHHIHIL